MVRVRGADEPRVRNVGLVGECLEALAHAVTQRARRHVLRLGDALHLHPMLVGARGELCTRWRRVHAVRVARPSAGTQRLVAAQHVGKHVRVQVPDMRLSVHIKDGRRHIVRLVRYPPPAPNRGAHRTRPRRAAGAALQAPHRFSSLRRAHGLHPVTAAPAPRRGAARGGARGARHPGCGAAHPWHPSWGTYNRRGATACATPRLYGQRTALHAACANAHTTQCTRRARPIPCSANAARPLAHRMT